MPPSELVHVVDADSSQATVIEETKRGRNLVIQGPPGTGKSQTIANIIAAAVKSGRTVLFVAEKMAALEVVERRLTNVGLGDITLELHSNKANRKAVLQDLERTLLLRKPRVEDVDQQCANLASCRDQLNRYLDLMHQPISPSGLTPYQVVGQLVKLRADGVCAPEYKLFLPLTWTRDEYQSRLRRLQQCVQGLQAIGVPAHHAWRDVQLEVILPTDVDRLVAKLPPTIDRLERLRTLGTQLASVLSLEPPRNASELSLIARTANHLAAAPPMDRSSVASTAWAQQRVQIEDLIRVGEPFSTTITILPLEHRRASFVTNAPNKPMLA